MAKILLTRSNEPGKQPTAEQMQAGELFLNYADGIIYFKKSDGTVGSFSYDGKSYDDAVLQQMIGLWNGYYGTNMNYTDYIYAEPEPGYTLN